MKKWSKALCAAALSVLVVAGAYTAVSAAAGGAGDPLVTLSYLTGVFTPKMETEMKALVENKAAELEGKFSQAIAAAGPGSGTGQGTAAGAVFSVVTLSRGQVLTGDVGCEMMLRVGSASCGGTDSVGLIDESDASTLSGGRALEKNHLYMVTISTRSVVAASDSVKLLVRGPYTVG